MNAVIAVLVAVALLAAWTLFLHKKSRGRIWSPMWIAFNLALVARLYSVGVKRCSL